MPKVVLLDADGVVVKKGEGYFSDRFVAEYGAPADEVRAFFKNEFRQCQVGKADLKVELGKRLPAWGWPKSVEEYLEYWFSNDVAFDEEVLAIAKDLQAKGVVCYLTTDQEKYRKEYILQRLQGKITGFWISCDLGVSKDDPEFFKEILKRWEGRYKPEEIMYFDDDQHNVDSAKSVGIDARLYTSMADLNELQ